MLDWTPGNKPENEGLYLVTLRYLEHNVTGTMVRFLRYHLEMGWQTDGLLVTAWIETPLEAGIWTPGKPNHNGDFLVSMRGSSLMFFCCYENGWLTTEEARERIEAWVIPIPYSALPTYHD